MIGLLLSLIGSKFGIGAAGLAVGFGLGRVKNKQKLTAVNSVVSKVETAVVAEVKKA